MGVAVRLECMRPAPGAIQGKHSLAMKALVERVLGDQRLQAADRLAVAAGGELGVERELGRAQVKLLEAADLGSRERLGSHVGKRRPAPELERLAGGTIGERPLGAAPRLL